MFEDNDGWNGSPIDLIRAGNSGSDTETFSMVPQLLANGRVATLLHREEDGKRIWYIAESAEPCLDVVRATHNHTLAVMNNPENNGGYSFVSYTWYAGDKDNGTLLGIGASVSTTVAALGSAPMIQVTWYGAKAYADWVGGALPTEAQWEYACRAGSETAYSYGDTADGDYMWDSSNSGSQTHKVGEKQPNAWGLYDIHGNVFEWCLDQWDYSENYPSTGTESDAISDPLVTTGSNRVLRGGSWRSSAADCRSGYRIGNIPGNGNVLYGFRVVFP